MVHTSSFDIINADAYFNEMVLPQYEEFINNNSSSRHALLSTIIVYHMYEWVHNRKFEQNDFRANYPVHQSLAIEFDVARKITNGTKHFKNKVQTTTQKGHSTAFDNGFSRPLIITYPNGMDESADIFLRKLVDFWKEQKRNGAF